MTAPLDSRGLISEAYRIEGITEAECRSIFLDWALGLPEGADAARYAQALLERIDPPPGHPMTAVLQSATEAAGPPRRRGGRSRVSAPALRPPTRGT